MTFFRPCSIYDLVSTVHHAARRCKAVRLKEGLDKGIANEAFIFDRDEMQAITTVPSPRSDKGPAVRRGGQPKHQAIRVRLPATKLRDARQAYIY